MEKEVRIVGKEVLADIRSGMTESQLKTKYRLSSRGIVRLFDRLADARLIETFELFERYPTYKQIVDNIRGRKSPRARLTVPMLVYDIDSSAIGVVRDLSITGLRVAGLKVNVGDKRTFQIPVDMFMNADPLLIIVECCWVRPKENKKYWTAGFKIVNLSERDASVLRTFIEFLVFSNSGEWQTMT
jgi:hypothetical protein